MTTSSEPRPIVIRVIACENCRKLAAEATELRRENRRMSWLETALLVALFVIMILAQL